MWDKIHPWNGFGYRYTVQSLTEDQVAARGLHVTPGAETVVGKTQDSADIVRLPARVTWTDPTGAKYVSQSDLGWTYNLGTVTLSVAACPSLKPKRP